MESNTSIRGISSAIDADSQLCASETPIHNDITHALALIRRPASIASFLILAFALSFISFLRFGWTLQFWTLVPLLTALALIIVLDLRMKVIPDFITLPAIIYTLVVAATLDRPPLLGAVLGALVGGGVLLVVAVVSRGALGGGDIKLMVMLGAALGWKGALVVLALSQVGAAIVALGLLIARRAGRHYLLPVGVFISFFGALMLLGAP